jgi:antitoxin (DNA-binding transcriptional repressor) of toxin-antitoxin stability system
VAIEEAQAKLPEMIDGLPAGEEVVIARNGTEVAKLTRTGANQRRCEAGCYRKNEFWMAPDFDAPLDDFKKYME